MHFFFVGSRIRTYVCYNNRICGPTLSTSQSSQNMHWGGRTWTRNFGAWIRRDNLFLYPFVLAKCMFLMGFEPISTPWERVVLTWLDERIDHGGRIRTSNHGFEVHCLAFWLYHFLCNSESNRNRTDIFSAANRCSTILGYALPS